MKILELLRLYSDGTISDLLDLLNAIKARDYPAIRAFVVKVASRFGYAEEATEIDDIAREIMEVDVAGIVWELGDAMQKFSVKYLGYQRVMQAPFDVRNATSEQAKAWWAGNYQLVREGSKNRLVKLLFRRRPELLDVISGEADQRVVQGLLSPEQIERLIDFLEAITPWLTVIAAAFPYVAPVAIVVKLIVTRYRTNHPDDGTVPEVMGIGLDDLLGFMD